MTRPFDRLRVFLKSKAPSDEGVRFDVIRVRFDVIRVSARALMGGDALWCEWVSDVTGWNQMRNL